MDGNDSDYDPKKEAKKEVTDNLMVNVSLFVFSECVYCAEWVVVQRFRFQPAELPGSLSSQDLDDSSLKQNCIIYFCHFVAVNASHYLHCVLRDEVL